MRPSVIQPTVTTPSATPNHSQITTPHAPSRMMNNSPQKPEDKLPAAPNAVIPKFINVTVTPDIGHMIPRSGSPATRQVKQQQSRNSPSSRVINIENPEDSSLLHLYANANVSAPHFANAQLTQRFGAEPVTLANGMPAPPAKVTQGKSFFGNGEKVWYGDPKDALLRSPLFKPTSLPHNQQLIYPKNSNPR